jgi:hypothetical protein
MIWNREIPTQCENTVYKVTYVKPILAFITETENSGSGYDIFEKDFRNEYSDVM